MILFLSYEDNILSMFNHQRDPLCRPTREILYGIYNRYKPARDPSISNPFFFYFSAGSTWRQVGAKLGPVQCNSLLASANRSLALSFLSVQGGQQRTLIRHAFGSNCVFYQCSLLANRPFLHSFPLSFLITGISMSLVVARISLDLMLCQEEPFHIFFI